MDRVAYNLMAAVATYIVSIFLQVSFSDASALSQYVEAVRGITSAGASACGPPVDLPMRKSKT